jgi:hypothetical protein
MSFELLPMSLFLFADQFLEQYRSLLGRASPMAIFSIISMLEKRLPAIFKGNSMPKDGGGR